MRESHTVGDLTLDGAIAQGPRPPEPINRYTVPQSLAKLRGTRFHVMVKPAGSACNLDCTYCFYLSKQKLRDGPGAGRMDDDLLDRFIRDYIHSVTADEVVFSWQGGEPTLLGVEYFEKVVALQRKHSKSGQRIENDLQTNGTLLDDDWAKFLKQNNFLVGLSIDGPRDIHDHFRLTKHAEPTFDKVYAAAQMLRRHGVRFNTLTCVHRFNASRPLDVYRFLRRELGSTYLQFIPIVEPRSFETTAPQHWDATRLPLLGAAEARPDHPDSVVTPWSVDADEYGHFLSKVWDEWRARDFGKVLVNFCAPPPVSTMPLSTMSAASSGGVRSSAISTASTIALSGSLSESRISSEFTTTVFGMPATMSRPFTSIVSCWSSGYAFPIVILMRSAVCSPMAMLYLRFM